MIFVRNPVLGEVKTRLASEIGKVETLKVYKMMLDYTRQITISLPMDKGIFYSDHIENDNWPDSSYQKYLQVGEGLGERMSNAFRLAFDNGYKSVSIIGSNCFELTPEIIDRSFEKLSNHDVAIGPAADGGYYLLGMNELQPGIFNGKEWSTSTVLEVTLSDLKKLGRSYFTLPTLADIDTVKDLSRLGKLELE